MAARVTGLRRGVVVLAVLALPAALAGAAGPAGAVVTTCSGAAQDTNGDGFGDVAIGEPGGGATGGGRVHVFYGTSTGLATAPTGDAPDDQLLAQGVGGVPGTDSGGDAFGATVAIGDLDADGCADLVVGVPGNAGNAGALVVLHGSPGAGIISAGAQLITENVVAAGQAQAHELFGSGIAIGDFNGDGRADVAASAPGEAVVSGGTDRGAVLVVYGSPSGLGNGTPKARRFTQDSAGIPGASEDDDQFGFLVAGGDVTGDGIDDVVVGVPGENLGAGAVQVVPGALEGTARATGRTFSQDTAGVPGAAEAGDAFGIAVAVGDVDGDGGKDVVVGAAFENDGQGNVTVLYAGGSGAAVTGAGAQTFSQNTTGVDGVPGVDDGFGFAVTTANLDGDPFADVVVGTPGDTVGTHPVAGSVTVMRGSASGVTTAGFGGARLSQDSVGVAGTPEKGDEFGFAVTGAPVTGSGRENLVVSAPGETIAGVASAGLSVVFAAPAGGPSGTGSRTLESGTAGVAGARTANGLWGWSID